MGVSSKQSTPNFPPKKYFLFPDTHTYTRFEICPFALLPTIRLQSENYCVYFVFAVFNLFLPKYFEDYYYKVGDTPMKFLNLPD